MKKIERNFNSLNQYLKFLFAYKIYRIFIWCFKYILLVYKNVFYIYIILYQA